MEFNFIIITHNKIDIRLLITQLLPFTLFWAFWISRLLGFKTRMWNWFWIIKALLDLNLFSLRLLLLLVVRFIIINNLLRLLCLLAQIFFKGFLVILLRLLLLFLVSFIFHLLQSLFTKKCLLFVKMQDIIVFK